MQWGLSSGIGLFVFVVDKYPVLERFFSVDNDIDFGSVTCGSGRNLVWECELGHVWSCRVRVVIRNLAAVCPFCDGRKLLSGFNDLATIHPELVEEWSDRNEFGPDTVSAGSRSSVWWKCQIYDDHVWEASLLNRKYGSGCPFCCNQKILAGFNDVAFTHPELVAEWSDRNEFGPDEVSYGSNKRVWWQCQIYDDHVWQVKIKDRLKTSGCPFCSGTRILAGFNDLPTIHPELVAERSDRNEFRPDGVAPVSHKKVWWKCLNGHDDYKAVVGNRTGRKSGCPVCGCSVSEPELYFYRSLKNNFGNDNVIHAPNIDGSRLKPDIMVLYDGLKFFVEFDGYFWHDYVSDCEHTKQLLLLMFL